MPNARANKRITTCLPPRNTRRGASRTALSVRRTCPAIGKAVGEVGVRFVAPGLPGFCKRASSGLNQVRRNLGEEARRCRSTQPFFAVAPAVNRPRNHERLLRSSHSHVKQAPFLFDLRYV